MFNTRSKSYIDLYSWRRFYAKTSDWMIRILNRCFFFRSFILNSVFFFLQVSCSLRMKCLHKNRKYAQIEYNFTRPFLWLENFKSMEWLHYSTALLYCPLWTRCGGEKIPLSLLNFQLDSHIFKIGAAVMNKTDN